MRYVPKSQEKPSNTSFRLDRETDALLDALAASLGVDRVDVLRIAVRDFAKKRGVEAK